MLFQIRWSCGPIWGNPMLEVQAIRVFRGEAQVLWDVSVKVRSKEVVTVLGANGAGKTTLFETILGLHHLEGEKSNSREMT